MQTISYIIRKLSTAQLLALMAWSWQAGLAPVWLSIRQLPGDGAAMAQEANSGAQLSEILSKSLTAYGGEEALSKLSGGLSIVGKEYDGPLKAEDLDKLENGSADASFRISRKGARWRFDHERNGSAGRAVVLSEGYSGDNAWVKSQASVEDLSADTGALLNWETMPPFVFLLETARAQEGGRGTLDVSYQGKVAFGGGSAHKIQVSNPDHKSSQAFSMLIEPNSFLVVGMEFQLSPAGEGKQVQIEYGEYRPAAGTVYPFRQIRRINGRIDVVRVASDFTAQNLRDADFDRPGGTFRLARSCKLPFDYSGREILVKGRLNSGEELDFLFDTGASETIIDRRVAAENYLLKEGVADLRALAGSVLTNTTSIGRLELGNLVVNDIEARILDLSPQSRNLGKRLAGIIGTNIISRYVVTIDYGKSLIYFDDAETFVRPQDVVVVPFLRKTAPVTKIRLNGKEEVQVLVDTGAAFNNLPGPVAQRYVSGDSTRRITEGTGLDGKPVKLGRVTVDNVTIGTRVLRKVDFTYTMPASAPSSGPNAGTAAAGASRGQPRATAESSKGDSGFFQTTNLGIIGNPFLENFVVFIDYKFQKMMLRLSSVLKTRSEVDQALTNGDNELFQKREFRLSEMYYQKALMSATAGGDKKSEAKILGRLANLRRMMAKDLNRPEHSKASYEYFVKAQELAKRIGAPDVEGRILADWSLLYLDSGQATSAKQTLDRALLLAPQDPCVNVDCAVHLYRSQRFVDMQRYIEKALFLEPSNWQALWYQVKLCENFSDMPKLLATLKEIVRYYPWSKLAQDRLKQVESSLNPVLPNTQNVVPATQAR